MKNSRKTPTPSGQRPRESAAPFFSPSWTPHLTSGIVALVTAAVVTMPLVVSEGALAFGTHLPVTMLIFTLIVGWSLLALQHLSSAAVPLRPTLLTAAVVVLLGWHTLSGVTHLSDSNGRWVLNAMWLWLGLGGIAWLIGQTMQSARQVRGLLAVMIAVGVVLVAQGGYQYFVSFPELRAQFEADRQTMLAGSDQQYLPGTPEYELLKNRVSSPEPLATFALTNSLAGYLAPWLIAASIVGLQMGKSLLRTVQRTRSDYVRFLAALAIIAALTTCLVLTHSRTGVLATIVSGGLFFLLTYWPHGRSRNWMLATGVSAAVIGVVAVFGLAAQDPSRWNGLPASVLYRIEYWHSTLKLVAGSPLFGCGPGNFQDFYSQFKLPQASETVADPHNFLMEVAATAGVPALILLLIALGLIARTIGPNCGREMGEPSPAGSQEQQSREVLPIYFGACIGVFLAWPFGLLVGFPAENIGVSGLPVFLILGLPLMIGVLAALHHWVLAGSWTLGDMGIVLAALFINLFAAGSTSFPGVIISAWLCGALVANEASRLRTASPSAAKGTTKFFAWGALAVGALLATACYFTAYRPVMQSRTHLEAGQMLHALGRFAQAEVEYRAAAADDPWSPVPWQNLAMMQLQLRQATERTSFEADLAEAADAMLSRSPHSASSWMLCGNWKLLAYRLTGRDSFLEESVRAYEQASQLYPSDAFIRAQLAWVHHLRRDEPAAKREAELAVQLDLGHSHRERKLAARHLEDMSAEFTKTVEPLPKKSALDLMNSILASEK